MEQITPTEIPQQTGPSQRRPLANQALPPSLSTAQVQCLITAWYYCSHPVQREYLSELLVQTIRDKLDRIQEIRTQLHAMQQKLWENEQESFRMRTYFSQLERTRLHLVSQLEAMSPPPDT